MATKQDEHNWYLHLPLVMLASAQESTGYTPFELVFGILRSSVTCGCYAWFTPSDFPNRGESVCFGFETLHGEGIPTGSRAYGATASTAGAV